MIVMIVGIVSFINKKDNGNNFEVMKFFDLVS